MTFATLGEMFEAVRDWGFERVFGRFYGIYRARVFDNRDPEKSGRVRVIVHRVSPDPMGPWLEPSTAGAGANRGLFCPPEIGDEVFMSFEAGDPSRPMMYFGGWFAAPDNVSEVPTELGYDTANPPVPRKRGFVTRAGHAFFFDETPGAESLEMRWHAMDPGDPARNDLTKTADRATGKTASLKFAPDGTITALNAAGAKLTLDATTKKILADLPTKGSIEINENGITVKTTGAALVEAASVELKSENVKLSASASEPGVLGQSLFDWLNRHTHPTGVGPSGPPIAPAPGTILSRRVTLG